MDYSFCTSYIACFCGRFTLEARHCGVLRPLGIQMAACPTTVSPSAAWYSLGMRCLFAAVAALICSKEMRGEHLPFQACHSASSVHAVLFTISDGLIARIYWTCRKLHRSVHSRLFILPASTKVYPAHDYKGHTCSTIGEEMAYNPRLTLSEDDFEKLMGDLHLPYPKMMDTAVPANMQCGG